jgi:alpha-N-arabinofuranosidase
VVNGNGTIEIDMKVPTLPQSEPASVPNRTTFENGKLGFEWVYLRNPITSNYSFVNGKLHLKASPDNLNSMQYPTAVFRRQQHINFTTQTEVALNNARNGDEAGLTMYMDAGAHYNIVLRKTDKGMTIALRCRLESLDLDIATAKVNANNATL